MVLRKNTRFTKKVYVLPAPGTTDSSVILIDGDNLVIDFNHAELRGSGAGVLPDRFREVAIAVRNGKNITIRNLKARGYKLAIVARNVEGLKIENCDLSYNYRQRLRSTQEKEDLADWMSYHQNEKDEWLRYGAAIYLRGCNGFTVRNCKVTGGQNALMLMACNRGRIYNNDFSFNSGIGIGMYRSSDNIVMYNKVNFNVRGYSHGIYSRGQDSAGFLVYEQSSNNLFAYNSATHSGDGFFLWAGQTTMDKGEGGSNVNQIRDNDFSYAPTNGVEVTFSSNIIARNRIFECDHGIWGGYSFNSVISGNQFRNNRIAIAIEHGLHNQIENNLFFRDGEAIRLWARARQPADWAYARLRDTRSAGYLIHTNSFNQNGIVFNLNRTDSINVFDNAYRNCGIIWKTDSTVSSPDSLPIPLMDTTANDPVIPGAVDPFKGGGKLAGRKNIRMTEWGPYDYRYPLIWLTNPADTSGELKFEVLGPKGRWRIVSTDGSAADMPWDSLPGGFRLARPEGRIDIEVEAEYTGMGFTDPFGNTVAAGKPYRFRFRKFFQPIDFQVRWYAFDSSSNPITTGSLERLLADTPFLTRSADRLDFAWWGGIRAGNRSIERFVTIAEGTMEVEAGSYELGITWDDAVRVYVDGRMIVDEWDPEKYRFDESPHRVVPLNLSAGKHSIRVEHAELGGFATLSLKLNKL